MERHIWDKWSHYTGVAFRVGTKLESYSGIACEQAILFRRAKRAEWKRVSLARLRYPPNGELARRLLRYRVNKALISSRSFHLVKCWNVLNELLCCVHVHHNAWNWEAVLWRQKLGFTCKVTVLLFKPIAFFCSLCRGCCRSLSPLFHILQLEFWFF